MAQLRRRRPSTRGRPSTRTLTLSNFRLTKAKKVAKAKTKKKRRSPLTEETFKEIMMQFMNKYHPLDVSEIQKLEEEVKRASQTPHPGISTKLSRDKLKREVLRQQNARLSEQQAPVTPYGAPHPPAAASQRDIMYDPSTKQYSYLRRKKKKAAPPPAAAAAPRGAAGGATPKRTTRIPTPTLTRVLEYPEDSDEQEEDWDEADLQQAEMDDAEGGAEWKSPAPPTTPRDEWKKRNVLKGVPSGQQAAVAPKVYDAVNKVVNTQGMLTSVGRPKPVFDYLINPEGKIPPHGIDMVLYEYKDNPSQLPVKIMSGTYDVSTPFMKKMEALGKLSVDFRVYQEHIRTMSSSEVKRFMAAVKKLPTDPTTDQYNKMTLTLSEHLKKENPTAYRRGQASPKSMLKASSNQGFITMVEAATKN